VEESSFRRYVHLPIRLSRASLDNASINESARCGALRYSGMRAVPRITSRSLPAIVSRARLRVIRFQKKRSTRERECGRHCALSRDGPLARAVSGKRASRRRSVVDFTIQNNGKRLSDVSQRHSASRPPRPVRPPVKKRRNKTWKSSILASR